MQVARRNAMHIIADNTANGVVILGATISSPRGAAVVALSLVGFALPRAHRS